MAVLVTKPETDMVGVANIFSEKVAVKVTIPEVIIVSELTRSSLDNVNVAVEGQVPQFGRLA